MRHHKIRNLVRNRLYGKGQERGYQNRMDAYKEAIAENERNYRQSTDVKNNFVSGPGKDFYSNIDISNEAGGRAYDVRSQSGGPDPDYFSLYGNVTPTSSGDIETSRLGMGLDSELYHRFPEGFAEQPALEGKYKYKKLPLGLDKFFPGPKGMYATGEAPKDMSLLDLLKMRFSR